MGMSRKGNVSGNAAMESRNSTFELECGERFPTNAVAEEAVFDYIEVFLQSAAPSLGNRLSEPGGVRDGSTGAVSDRRGGSLRASEST